MSLEQSRDPHQSQHQLWQAVSVTNNLSRDPEFHPHLCQCFIIAAVESMMVPSMSNNRLSKETLSGGAEKLIVQDLFLFRNGALNGGGSMAQRCTRHAAVDEFNLCLS